MDRLTLFDVNGDIGCSAYGEADYPTATALVEQLDYLGIDRTLVSHAESRELNPTWGNRRLLREIEASGHGDRLLPAFTVSPSCYFENGVLPFLKEKFSSGQVRAIRIYPEICRYPVLHLERILAELAVWRPAVLWNCPTFANENDIRDFVTLAGKFPEMSFLFTQKMWPGFGSLIDALWRQKNIYVDISWVHMRDTVKLMIDDFGADRLVFGTGYKAHYGAAVAALAHYPITPDQRELIGHGNIERLLRLPPLEKKLAVAPALLARKPLWQRCRNGLPLEGVPLIDAHAHAGPANRGWYVRQIDFPEIAHVMINQMDRLGVKKTVISAETALFGNSLEGNLFAEKTLTPYPGRFAGYLVFNPRYKAEMVPAFDSFFQRGFFVGFKILAAYWKIPLTHPDYEAVWSYADHHRLPILVHTWDDSYNSPAMLKEIVRKYPHANFLLGHSGGGTRGRLEAEELAVNNANVHLEFCGSFCTPRPFETSMGLVGNDRVIFGSDTGGHDQAWELGRYLSMPLPDDQLIPGLGRNFEKLEAQSTK
jgi:predicted TIM-barrel fold metal-dependent hydrolase